MTVPKFYYILNSHDIHPGIRISENMQIKIVSRWQDGKPQKCVLCTALKKNLRQALNELGLSELPIEECSSQEEYDAYGVIVTPLLIINGKIKLSGRVPPKEMLKEFLKFELREDEK